MIVLLLTTLRSMWSKVGVYLMAGLAVVTAILAFMAYVAKAVKTQERLKNATAVIEAARREQKIVSEIDSMSAADARNKLRQRWLKR